MHIISKGMRRLPCLPSSNLSQEILMGTDTCIDPRDVFNGLLLLDTIKIRLKIKLTHCNKVKVYNHNINLNP